MDLGPQTVPAPTRLARPARALAASVVVLLGTLGLVACGDDDAGGGSTDGSATSAAEAGTDAASPLPALVVEHVHLLSQATLAQVGGRADQLGAAQGALAANGAAIADALGTEAPGLEGAWMAHVAAFGAYTAAAMGGDADGIEAAAAEVERTGEAVISALEGDPAPGGGSGVTSSTGASGPVDTQATEGAPGADGGTGADSGQTGQGPETDQGDASADQGMADSGEDGGAAPSSDGGAQQDGEDPQASGVGDVLQGHIEGTLASIDAVVAGDLVTAAKLTAANAEEMERLAAALDAGRGVDHSALDAMAEHAEHPLAAGAATDALVQGRGPEHEAAMEVVEANTTALLEHVRASASRGDAETFERLWRGHLDAYLAYARGAMAGDQAATAAALGPLAELVDGVAALVDRWTGGTVPEAEAATELQRHVDGTLRTIDAQVAGDHPTVYRLTHEGVLHFATFGHRVAAAMDAAQSSTSTGP